MAITVRPSVPTSHASESEHRRQLANTVNLLNQTTPDSSDTEAELEAGVRIISRAYPPGDPRRIKPVVNGEVKINIPSDVETLQDAIDLFPLRVPGVTTVLNIESGFRPSSGIVVEGGDYRHIWISSEDSEVLVADDFVGDFCRGVAAGMPTLATIIDMNNKGDNGYYVSSGSVAVIRPNCGVKNAVLYTLDVTGNSYVQAQGAIFDGSQHTRNIHVTHSSRLNLLEGVVRNSANIGLYCSHGGTIAAYGVTIDGAGAAGAQANQGGYMDLFQAVIRNAGTGILSRHGANVSAQLAQVSDVQDGLIAQGSSSIAFDKGTVTGTISRDSIRCVDGSRVDAGEALLSGAGRYCAYAVHNSFINLRQAKCNDAGEHGIYAYGGSTIAADLAEANRAGIRGVYANGSCIFFRNGEANDAGGYGIFAENGATISAEGASANNAGDHGIFANNASTINAKGATANSPTNNGFYAYRASTLNCEEGTSSGAGGNSVVAREGSKINCALANVQKGEDPDTGATSADIRVREGSIINARGATGGLNQAENTLTAHGIIFR